MYAFLITVDSTDARNQVVQLIKGNNSILDLVEGAGAYQAGDPPETIYEYFILKPSLLPAGTPQIKARAWMALNAGVPAVVKNEYSQNSALWRTIDFNGIAVTRDFMNLRIRQEAGFEGCTHVWVLRPGDSLAGDLLSKFVPI